MTKIRDPLANAARRRLLAGWESHGGGFYGLVALMTFIYLEWIDLSGDVAGLSFAALDFGFIVSFVIGNMIDAFINVIRASMWPVWWIRNLGVGLLSGALLGASYLAYLAVRPALLRLLEPTAEVAAVTGADERVLEPHTHDRS